MMEIPYDTELAYESLSTFKDSHILNLQPRIDFYPCGASQTLTGGSHSSVHSDAEWMQAKLISEISEYRNYLFANGMKTAALDASWKYDCRPIYFDIFIVMCFMSYVVSMRMESSK